MSKPARVGGYVQISKKRYRVVRRCGPVGEWWFLIVQCAKGLHYAARSERWRCGRGPWKIEHS
jgi:hypothetical protein